MRSQIYLLLLIANLTERTAGVGAVPAAAHPHDEQLVTSLLFLQHTGMLYFFLLKTNIDTECCVKTDTAELRNKLTAPVQQN